MSIGQSINWYFYASILIDVKNMNRRSYKGVDDYGSVINVGDGYYNDAYEDEESKYPMK